MDFSNWSKNSANNDYAELRYAARKSALNFLRSVLSAFAVIACAMVILIVTYSVGDMGPGAGRGYLVLGALLLGAAYYRWDKSPVYKTELSRTNDSHNDLLLRIESRRGRASEEVFRESLSGCSGATMHERAVQTEGGEVYVYSLQITHASGKYEIPLIFESRLFAQRHLEGIRSLIDAKQKQYCFSCKGHDVGPLLLGGFGILALVFALLNFTIWSD